jgi:hypothetical protein
MPEVGMPDEIQPDVAEVLQEESDAPALMDHPVLVRQDGPVLIHDLPSRVSVARKITLGATTELLVGRDRRRKRVVVVATGDQGVLLGTSQADVTQGNAPYYPPNVPIELRHAEPVYARAGGIGAAGLVLGAYALAFAASARSGTPPRASSRPPPAGSRPGTTRS